MPIKLIDPRPGKTPYYYGRGTYLGQFVDRSTGAVKAPVARQVIRKWEREIECGEFATKGEPTFLSAAVAYLKDGGFARPLPKLIEHFGEKPLRLVDQAAIDAAAFALFPTQSPATRNREVFTPVSAVLKHAGVRFSLRRPKGARGREITTWLWPEQAQRLFAAAATVDAEFAIFLVVLCYTGMRLSEGLGLETAGLRLADGTAHLPTTKNGKPRAVFLPPVAVAALANHPRGCDKPGRIFRFRKSGRLYILLDDVRRIASGILKLKRPKKPPRIPYGGKERYVADATAIGAARSSREVERKEAAKPYEFDWVNFRTFRHTWATWMRRYGGLDTKGLVATGAWLSEQAASRYAHAVVTEEARKAMLLPVGETLDLTLKNVKAS